MGVLLVEKHIHRVLEIAHRVYVLAQGRVRYASSAGEARSRVDEIERHYFSHAGAAASQPVLQVVGGADRVTFHEGARWLAERLADARVVELDGVGHYPMFEAGAEFRAALLEFVSAHPAHRDGHPLSVQCTCRTRRDPLTLRSMQRGRAGVA